GAGAVAFVAAAQVGLDRLERVAFPARLQLLPAALRTGLHAGGDKQLHIGLGRDHGADIAPVEHGPAGLKREAALALVQRLAHGRVDRDAARQPPCRFAAQLWIGQQPVRKGRRGERVAGIVGVAAVEEHLASDGAIEQPGVEVRQAVMRGEGAGDGAFARGGGSVDGDDHRRAVGGKGGIENRDCAAYLAGAGGHVPRARARAFKTGTARQLTCKEAAVAWFMLLTAGVFETVWAYYMKLSDGFTRVGPTAATFAAMAVSIGLLGLAMKSLPLGTAYMVWTGIGAVGAFVVGVVVLGEAV